MCECGPVLGKSEQASSKIFRIGLRAWIFDAGRRHQASLVSAKHEQSEEVSAVGVFLNFTRLESRGKFHWRAAAELPRGAKTHSAVELGPAELFFRQLHILEDFSMAISGIFSTRRSSTQRCSQHVSCDLLLWGYSGFSESAGGRGRDLLCRS